MRARAGYRPTEPLQHAAGRWGLNAQGQIRRPRPSDMPADMPSDMSSEGHCILMAVWGEDDARVPALVLYA